MANAGLRSAKNAAGDWSTERCDCRRVLDLIHRGKAYPIPVRRPNLKLRDALPEHLKTLFVTGYHLGMRLVELRKLQWEQIDLAAGEIRLLRSQTKGKRARTVPIYGDMKEWFDLQLANRNERWPDVPWVFNWLNRPIGAHLKGWKKACKAVGLPGLHFHDLRRSAVRTMERAGIARRVAMEITGHRTEAIYRRYDIVDATDLSQAGSKLAEYLKRQAEALKKGKAAEGIPPEKKE